MKGKPASYVNIAFDAGAIWYRSEILAKMDELAERVELEAITLEVLAEEIKDIDLKLKKLGESYR